MEKFFKVQTDKDPLSYRCGETAVFKVCAAENHKGLHCEKFKWVLKGDDGSESQGYGKSVRGREFKIEGTCKTPGFLRLTVTALNLKDEVNPDIIVIEAGAGFDVDEILFHSQIPEDYDKFWGEIEEEIQNFTPVLLESTPVTDMIDDGFEGFDIRISTPWGPPASGMLTIPKGDGKFPADLEFMGYGIDTTPATCVDGRINIFLNAHGIENQLNGKVLKEKYSHLEGYGFNKDDNESPYTTYWKGVITRDLVAAKYIKSLPQWDGKNLTAKGGSQGAFRATNVAARDKAINYLDILIPWCCDLDSANHGFMKGWRPIYQKGLAYYDTAAAITRVKCPVHIKAHLGDYICPPASVMALYNNCKTLKSIDFVQCWTHSYTSPQYDSFRIYHDPENPEDILKGKKWADTEGNILTVLDEFKDFEGKTQVLYKSEKGETKLIKKEIWNDILYVDGAPTRRFKEIK